MGLLGSKKRNEATFEKQESRLAEQSGGRKQPRSGAGDVEKADVKQKHDYEYLIEAKSTDKQSISIKAEYLKKVVVQSVALHRKPALAITFAQMPDGVPKDWIMVPTADLFGGGDDF